MDEATLLKLTTQVAQIEVELEMTSKKANNLLKWLREYWLKEFKK